MATGIELDLEVFTAGAAAVWYSGSLVNLAIALSRGETGNVEKDELIKSAAAVTIGLQRCGVTRDIPTEFGDSAAIIRQLERNELMSDIGNLLTQKHGHRQEGLWKITFLLGTSFGGPGGREALGPQITELAPTIPVPQKVVDACLDAKSMKPLRAWISDGEAGAGATRTVFIGHGRSREWRDLKDLLVERLDLRCVEFNSASIAGVPTTQRLEALLNEATFAFLVMTAEDIHADGSHHARENVVHEAGLFQGHLGFKRAIILLEQGCDEFSNITGLGQIRFPQGDILAKSEEIRMVLQREGMLAS